MMKQVLKSGLVVICVLGVVLTGCVSARRYRERNELLKLEVVSLQKENQALLSDVSMLQAQREKLIEKIGELQHRLPTPSQVTPVGELERILDQLRAKGLEFIYREGYPTMMVSGIFNPGKATVSREGKQTLLRIGKAIKSELPACSLRVDGYTDNQPIRRTKEYKSNKALSSARAKYVADFMVTDCGFDHHKVRYQGRGEANPIATNKTPSGREKNRRVEIVILIK